MIEGVDYKIEGRDAVKGKCAHLSECSFSHSRILFQLSSFTELWMNRMEGMSSSEGFHPFFFKAWKYCFSEG